MERREPILTLDAVQQAIASGNRTTIEQVLEHAGGERERAELLEHLSDEELNRLATLLGDDSVGELLGELDFADAADILERLAVADAADILEAMDPDEAADVIAEIAPAGASEILIAMEPVEADELRELLAYPPDTAGGRMTPALVSIAPSLRADQAIVALRHVAQEAETISYVYVTDQEERLLGVLSLRSLVLSPPDTPVSELTTTDVVTVRATDDQEVAARLLTEHDLIAVPVVDDENHLLGIITVDDVADILEQETTEDIERLGGSQPLAESYLRATPVLLWRRRVIWLLVLFVAGGYTGTVMEYFQEELDTVVALTFFIPLLIGIGGNVGSQVVTTVVRAMSVGDIEFRDVFRIIRKELLTGVMLGAVMAAAMFARAALLGVGVDLALVVSVTVTVIVLWAALIAAILPLTLRRLRVDPAVVSAPLITTLVDGTGLVLYFMIARLILDLD